MEKTPRSMGHDQHCSDQICRAGLEPWFGFLVDLFDVVLRDEFPRTWSLLLLTWHGEEWNTSITKSQRSRAGIPSVREPASRENSVELCETEVCFLHNQLIGTNVWLPKMHRIPPDVDFESRSPAKSESWNSTSLHCCAVFPTWQYCLNSLAWWMYEIKRAQRLSRTLVHFVIARASLFRDHKKSGLPMRAKYKHFRTMCEQTFDNSPTDPFLLPWIGGRQCMVLRLCTVVALICSLVRKIFPHISSHDLPYHRTMRKCLRQVSQSKEQSREAAIL